MISLPSGNVIKSSLDASTIDFIALLDESKRKSFNGYFSLCVYGGNGLEEGTLVFDNGKIVASFYEYYRYNKLVLGDQALPRVINAAAAKQAMLDIIQLNNDQVRLLLAFNEKAISIPTENDIKKLKVSTFSTAFEDEVKTEEGAESKESLFKKYKLSGIKQDNEKEDNGEII